MINQKCRFCGTHLKYTFADLGMSPLSNSYLRPDQLMEREIFYPLHAYVCEGCLLVQLDEFEAPEQIFSDYAYFSSYAATWLRHVQQYADMVTTRFDIHASSQVVEIASNDGYLLQYFKQKGTPVLGIEPAANVAKIAIEKGIPTAIEFFGKSTANKIITEYQLQADLLIANNVLAHVPDLLDFVAGMKLLLKPGGVITVEFPYLLELIKNNQFDTIYHEHFSYFSLMTVQKIFASQGLTIFDVDELSTHGGSLRVYARHGEDSGKLVHSRVNNLLLNEETMGLTELALYRKFNDQVKETKWKILNFLISARREGKTIAGYGAPAKGNTLLNFCGIRTDFMDYTVDRSPYKQGLYLPGTHIPIEHPEKIRETKPDYLLILPWNLQEEVMEQMSYIREWGGKFVIPIPEVKVI
ncbi:methyltransferase domain-containing protein [Cohnella suwonensis]|uniref:Methyltransferase domain-containing protein n=1 Tax=Cohnella suwonensis TaxID=696072 RepID=A0ABW0LWK1_9BACL